MKKLSLLMAIAMVLTISGVYAAWIYSQADNVFDVNSAKAINITDAEALDTPYGNFSIENDLTFTIDPKAGTQHITSLIVEGQLTLIFTPSDYASTEIKTKGIDAFFSHELTNANWTFDDGHGAGARNILTLSNATHTIHTADYTGSDPLKWTWNATKARFECVTSADRIATHYTLTEFNLDTKAKYDAFDLALEAGQIRFHLADGKADTSSAGA